MYKRIKFSCLFLLCLHLEDYKNLSYAEKDIDFPPKLDSDDISYFASNHDIDGLHWALSNVFARSVRNPDASQIIHHELPKSIVARGGGNTYTSAYKLKVDMEQVQYLSEQLQVSSDHESDEENIGEKQILFRNIMTLYEKIYQRVPSLDQLSRTKGLYPFSKQDYDDGIASIYNKAWHHTNIDELKDSNGNVIPLLSSSFDASKIENQWYDPDTPPVVVIDDLLSTQALENIRKVLLESTVWFETKMPIEFGGYVGAYIDDGLHDRILLQLAFELNKALPNIMKGHPLQYLWAYKYDSQYRGIKTHADQAAVNVNIWLTREDANLDKESGGLVIFTTKPPADWDFAKYNSDTDKVREEILKPTNYANITVPYRENRAVIFDSMLFHHTDEFSFKEGYGNRRINLTILYGQLQTQNENEEL